MSKADNYNKYNYNQASEQNQYIIRDLSMSSRSEVLL